MVDSVPHHLRTVTARLLVDDSAAAIAFYEKAFGAEEIGERYVLSNGKVAHAEFRIGDSVLSISDTDDATYGASPIELGNVSTVISLAVPDVDKWWNRAIAAGATEIYPLADQFYGDRAGRLRDPSGQQWMLSTHIEDVDRAEFERRLQAMQDGN